MDLRKVAVAETAFLHLRDAEDNLLFDGEGDAAKPVGITLYGPGSKPYARATAAKSSRLMERMRKKGKIEVSADENAEENATFLAACTQQFHNIEREGLDGEALFKAVYSDASIGFVAEQAAKHLADWANFSKGSPKN